MTQFLQDVIYAVIIAAVPIITKYAIDWLYASKEKITIDNELTNTLITDEIINTAIDSVADIVAFISQTYVDSLKKSGSFTVEAQESARANAIDAAKVLIAHDTQVLISSLYGDFDVWLGVQIEKAVKAQKK